MTMPRVPVPCPRRSRVPVEPKPAVPGLMLPPLVSIVTPMPLLTPALEMVPLLVSELLELMVTAAVLLVPMATLPVASMVMLPLVEVSSGVEVAVKSAVSARAQAAGAAASRAAAAAESIKRCLINTSLFKNVAGRGTANLGISLRQGPFAGFGHPTSPRECAPFYPSPGAPPPRGAGRAVWHAPLYPAIVPVQQQFLAWAHPSGAKPPVLI